MLGDAGAEEHFRLVGMIFIELIVSASALASHRQLLLFRGGAERGLERGIPEKRLAVDISLVFSKMFAGCNSDTAFVVGPLGGTRGRDAGDTCNVCWVWLGCSAVVQDKWRFVPTYKAKPLCP